MFHVLSLANRYEDFPEQPTRSLEFPSFSLTDNNGFEKVICCLLVFDTKTQNVEMSFQPQLTKKFPTQIESKQVGRASWFRDEQLGSDARSGSRLITARRLPATCAASRETRDVASRAAIHFALGRMKNGLSPPHNPGTKSHFSLIIPQTSLASVNNMPRLVAPSMFLFHELCTRKWRTVWTRKKQLDECSGNPTAKTNLCVFVSFSHGESTEHNSTCAPQGKCVDPSPHTHPQCWGGGINIRTQTQHFTSDFGVPPLPLSVEMDGDGAV